MSKTKTMIAVVAVLSALCLSLLAYIAHSRITRGAADPPCAQPLLLSASDFRWTVSDVFLGGPLHFGQWRLPHFLEHWGEDEFAVFHAAMNTLTPFADDFTPPWANYLDTRRGEWFMHHWWSLWINTDFYYHVLIQPLDKAFSLWAYDHDATNLAIEVIDFLYSTTHGAFAITRHGNFPHRGYCNDLRFFHMDTAAFYDLLNVIEIDN